MQARDKEVEVLCVSYVIKSENLDSLSLCRYAIADVLLEELQRRDQSEQCIDSMADGRLQ